MRKLLLIIPVLILSACEDAGKMAKRIDRIEEEVIDENNDILEKMRILRGIADEQQDTALYNALYGIAYDVESIIEFHNTCGRLESLKEDCAE